MEVFYGQVFVLAIITTILSSNSGAKEMISGILTVIILFISIYSIYVAISKLASFPNKRMYQQLKCFASDAGCFGYTVF